MENNIILYSRLRIYTKGKLLKILLGNFERENVSSMARNVYNCAFEVNIYIS